MDSYSEKEFTKLKWRVDKVDLVSYDPFVSFPEIAFYPEFNDPLIKEVFGSDFGKVFAYLVFAHDPSSPYVRYNDNIIKRKRDAAKAASFRLNKENKFKTLTEDIILNNVDIFNRLIIRFFRVLKSSEWASYITYLDALFELLGLLKSGSGLEVSDYRNTILNTKELRTEIKKLEESFLEGDNSQVLVDMLYDTIETDDLDLSPEDIAHRTFMKQEPKLFNPYASDKTIDEFILEHKKNIE